MNYLYNILFKFRLFIIVIICITTISDIAISQDFYNNGADVVINNGAWVIISGDFLNNSSFGNDGTVISNGEMVVQGDWVNNANNTVFPLTGGEVIMNGANLQTIYGKSNTTFQDLTLQNSDKLLANNYNSTSGTLNLDAVLNLNANTFIINNPNFDALNYQSKYILSETLPGSYGEVQWNLGNSLGNYTVPFGSGAANYNDLNLSLTTTSPGNPADGYISFATYPTDFNNYPLPTGVNSLGEPASLIADRYWIIDPRYTINPDVDILFTYTVKDVNPVDNPALNPALLRAESYCTTCGSGWKPQGSSQSFPANNTVSVSNVSGSDCYAPWRLDVPVQEVTMFMPNAFTPGSDGLNDKFGPIGDSLKLVKNYEFLIYNRWGGVIFQSNDVNNQWDGSLMNDNQKAPQGVYVWLIDYINTDGNRITKRGSVTLLRNGK